MVRVLVTRCGVSHAPGGGIGDARLALEVFRGQHSLDGAAFEQVRRAMEQPQPRVALGLALRGLATAAIDVSDGLVGDLGHVLARSSVGAVIEVARLPLSPVLAAQPLALQQQCALAGGDDYELLFTAPAGAHGAVLAAAKGAGVAASCIGRIEAGSGLRLQGAQGRALALALQGFDHFKGAA